MSCYTPTNFTLYNNENYFTVVQRGFPSNVCPCWEEDLFQLHAMVLLGNIVNISIYSMLFYVIKPDDMYNYAYNTIRFLCCMLILYMAILKAQY